MRSRSLGRHFSETLRYYEGMSPVANVFTHKHQPYSVRKYDRGRE